MSRVKVTRSDVEAAAGRVAAVVRPTPVYAAEALSRVVGRPVLLKPEHRQRTGSFKIRGAYNLISQLDPSTPSVVAASAGNHAQGVAFAAHRAGIPATIFMPSSVSLPKLQATRDYGAAVELVAGDVEDAIEAALRHAEATGAVWVHPYDDAHIQAGQGTIGLEIDAEAPEAEVVLVPVGGGGLLTGMAAACTKHLIGVRPVDPAATMADGIAVRAPLSLDAEMVRVSEEDISRAVLLLLERAKSVVEPAGAVGLAALLAGAVPGDGPAVVVLSGGNVDPLLLTRIVDHGLSAAGRYLVVTVVLADRPGQLAALSATIAELGANVLSIEHHRTGIRLGFGDALVRLTLETRDRAHGDELVGGLRSAGFTVDPD
jgi:threonine dehydratase